MKSVVFLGALIFITVLTAIRRAEGRKKLAMLEEGKMCVHCGSTHVVPGEAGVVCQACGQTTLWTLIKHPPLTKAEIDQISARDGRSPFDS